MAMSTDRQGRYERGKVVLDAIDGEAGEKVIDALGDVSPELAHQVVAWGFGEMYSRPGLEPRDRQLVTLGMLTALGGLLWFPTGSQRNAHGEEGFRGARADGDGSVVTRRTPAHPLCGDGKKWTPQIRA